MHRSYQPTKPATNKALAKKWDDIKFGSHRDRVRGAKSMVDSKPPKVHSHMAVKMKKLQLEEERTTVIDRDNRMLLEKMSTIMHTRGRIDDRNDYQHKSLNREKRQRESMSVLQENQRMVRRLKERTTKPNYDNAKMAVDWEQKKAYARTIAQFPPDWYEQMEEAGLVRPRGAATGGGKSAPASMQTREPLPPIRSGGAANYSDDASDDEDEDEAAQNRPETREAIGEEQEGGRGLSSDSESDSDEEEGTGGAHGYSAESQRTDPSPLPPSSSSSDPKESDEKVYSEVSDHGTLSPISPPTATASADSRGRSTAASHQAPSSAGSVGDQYTDEARSTPTRSPSANSQASHASSRASAASKISASRASVASKASATTKTSSSSKVSDKSSAN